MAEIVNLRRHRKRVAREDREAKAAEQRTRFGRSKAERDRAARESESVARHLDGHRRDETDEGA